MANMNAEEPKRVWLYHRGETYPKYLLRSRRTDDSDTEYIRADIAKKTAQQEREAVLREVKEHFEGLTPSTIGYYSQPTGFSRDEVVEEIEVLINSDGGSE